MRYPKKRRPKLAFDDVPVEGNGSAPADLAASPSPRTVANHAPTQDGGDDLRAVTDAINALIRAQTPDEVVRSTLDTIRRAFGWAYGSYWVVDPAERVLKFSLDSGSVGEEFQRVTLSARFREGEGLNGRAWRQRDLFFVADLADLNDCCRAPAAHRAGVRSGLALPIEHDGRVVGTMDFFASHDFGFDEARLDALRALARVIGDKVGALQRQDDLLRVTRMMENVPINMMYTDL